MPPSAITGTPWLVGFFGAVHDGGELRHADAGDDAGGADRARPDADLDASAPASISALAASARRDVAGDDAGGIALALDALHRLERRRAEWPCAVSTTSRSTPASISAIERSIAVVADAGGRGDAQAALRILDRHAG